uniref:Uncharacterized protein n=1 Tax=Romanomermis culicivorax TaxID=13658 RepID=A0A915K3J2_ROMCU
VNGKWFWRLSITKPLAAVLASPCSAAEFAYVNDLLARHAQSLDLARCTAFYACLWYRANGNPEQASRIG